MGWKNVKEKFGITHHVQVDEGKICIGSGYVSALATIDPATGRVHESEAFRGFLDKHYPALLAASPEDLAALIAADDTFHAAITVYTYEGSQILENKCEVPGYPNVTVDGRMMYENTYSTDKNKVIRWAKENAAIAAEHTGRRIEEVELELARLKDLRARYMGDVAKLNADFPDGVAVP